MMLGNSGFNEPPALSKVKSWEIATGEINAAVRSLKILKQHSMEPQGPSRRLRIFIVRAGWS